MKYFEKAKQHYKEKNYERATELFSAALEADPDNAYIYYERGISYFHLDKKSLALMDMDKAAELQPDNPYRYSSRAFIRDACGDIDGAIKDYKKAIDLDPEDAVAHNNLGLLEEKKGYTSYQDRYKKADELAAKYQNFKDQPEEDNFVNRYVKLGDQVNIETEKAGEEEVENREFWREIKRVFLTKKGFGEFLNFVKNGFKL